MIILDTNVLSEGFKVRPNAVRLYKVVLLSEAVALWVATLGGPSPLVGGGSLAGGPPGPDGRRAESMSQPGSSAGSADSSPSRDPVGTIPPGSEAFNIQAEAFQAGADIPRKFSCQGSDASPALAWTEPPAGTRSLALIADDPDAPGGTFVHWVLYDVPATARRLTEAVPPGEEIVGGGRQGTNDFGKIGYGGPCPPPGKPHRYFFKLYALDRKLNLKAGASKPDIEQAMKGHILAKTEVMGRYAR